MQQGKVIKAYNSFYYVEAENISSLISCKLRGRLKKERCQVVTGDQVLFASLADGTGVIEERLPRQNLLRRPPVANIDQVVLTFAAAEPDLHPLLLNRFLVLAEWSGIERIILCINKIDLLSEENARDFLSAYENLGYEILKVSAREGIGIDALKDCLRHKVSVFAGPSGVGKSTLLNAVDSTLQLTTGEISRKIKRGRHTTRIAQLMPFSEGGFVVDTPGFSVTDLESIDQRMLSQYFPEFRPYLGDCYYNTCLHDHEPDCAIKEALSKGIICAERYEAYLNILAEIKDRKKDYE